MNMVSPNTHMKQPALMHLFHVMCFIHLSIQHNETCPVEMFVHQLPAVWFILVHTVRVQNGLWPPVTDLKTLPASFLSHQWRQWGQWPCAVTQNHLFLNYYYFLPTSFFHVWNHFPSKSCMLQHTSTHKYMTPSEFRPLKCLKLGLTAKSIFGGVLAHS